MEDVDLTDQNKLFINKNLCPFIKQYDLKVKSYVV